MIFLVSNSHNSELKKISKLWLFYSDNLFYFCKTLK